MGELHIKMQQHLVSVTLVHRDTLHEREPGSLFWA